MKQIYSKHSTDIDQIVSKYESMLKSEEITSFDELVFIQLVDYYEKEFNLSKAFEAINKAIETYKFSPSLHARKAKLLLDTHDPDLATESIDRAEIFGYPYVEAQTLRAEALCQLGKYEESEYILRNLKLGYHPNSEELAQICFIEATIYECQDQYEKMFYALRATLLEKPTHEKALRRMFMCVELAKKHKESIVLHNQLIDQKPYSELAWFNLGHAYYYCNNYQDAIDSFEYAYIINPKFESAYRDCIEVCLATKNYSQGLKCIEEAIEHIDIDGDLLLKRGQCHEFLDDVAKAKVHYFRSLSYNPKDDEVYFRIAECYSKEQLWESAIHFYKQAIRIDQQREDYLVGLAKSYYNLGRIRKADLTFQKVIDMSPQESSIWSEYIELLIKRNELSKANLFLQEAGNIANGSELLYCHSACLFLNGEEVKAFSVLEEAVITDFANHNKIYELVPSLKNNRKVNALIRYFESEVG